MNQSKVTFIMPAYNVEKYIGHTIECILKQSLNEWKLIIVDDGSTDSTFDIAYKYSLEDTRIKIIKMESPSGSAYQPRKVAIMSADTDYVAPIDADDWVESNYLATLMELIDSANADIVYPTMYRHDGLHDDIPLMDKSYCNRVLEGKDCVKYTLNGWRVNCNGGIIKKELYLQAFETFNSDITYACADELLTRQLLWLAGKVVFSEEKYFYRVNEDSITRRSSSKLFDYLINNLTLLKLIKTWFSKDSVEYRLISKQNFEGIVDALRLLRNREFDSEAKEYANSLIEKCYAKIDWKLIKSQTSNNYYYTLRPGLRFAKFTIPILDLFRNQN